MYVIHLTNKITSESSTNNKNININKEDYVISLKKQNV